jgi:hypothetical protein
MNHDAAFGSLNTFLDFVFPEKTFTRFAAFCCLDRSPCQKLGIIMSRKREKNIKRNQLMKFRMGTRRGL